MKKTILATLIISIFFAFTCTASATTSGGQAAAKSTPASTDTVSLSNDTVMPASGSGVGLVFKRTSSSQAKAQVQANRAGASSITSTITLQKKSSGSYKKVTSASKTVYDEQINHIKYFSIASSGTYRIKELTPQKSPTKASSDFSFVLSILSFFFLFQSIDLFQRSLKYLYYTFQYKQTPMVHQTQSPHLPKSFYPVM